MRLQEWVRAERTRLQGKSHPDTLDATAKLADLYHMRGRLAEAVALQEEVWVVSGLSHARGVAHPCTLAAAAKLAWMYSVQGRYAEAGALLRHTTNPCQPF